MNTKEKAFFAYAIFLILGGLVLGIFDTVNANHFGAIGAIIAVSSGAAIIWFTIKQHHLLGEER